MRVAKKKLKVAWSKKGIWLFVISNWLKLRKERTYENSGEALRKTANWLDEGKRKTRQSSSDGEVKS